MYSIFYNFTNQSCTFAPYQLLWSLAVPGIWVTGVFLQNPSKGKVPVP